MANISFWMNLFFSVTTALGVCCLLALFARPVRVVFSSLFAIFYRPLSQIQERTSRYLQNAKTWLAAQIQDECAREGDGPLYFIIGAMLYSALTALFILCDFGMLVLTVQAMGMDEITFDLPMDTSTLTAATLVTTSLFWGAILFDILGVTHLAPWRKALSEQNRKLFMGVSIFFVAVSVFLGVTMAYWRGVSLVEIVPEAHAGSLDVSLQDQGNLSLSGEENVNLVGGFLGNMEDEDFMPVDTSSNWIVLSTLMGISGLSLASTAFSMIGLGIMAKFTILLLICLGVLALLPITFVSWLISSILSWIFNLVESILDLMIQIGNRFLQLFGWRQSAAESSAEATSPSNPPGGESEESQEVNNGTHDSAPDSGFNPFAGR